MTGLGLEQATGGGHVLGAHAAAANSVAPSSPPQRELGVARPADARLVAPPDGRVAEVGIHAEREVGEVAAGRACR